MVQNDKCIKGWGGTDGGNDYTGSLLHSSLAKRFIRGRDSAVTISGLYFLPHYIKRYYSKMIWGGYASICSNLADNAVELASLFLLEFNGIWDVTYSDDGNAAYRIDGRKITVLSCDFDKCKTNIESTIIPTDNETHYPSREGWKKINQIHRVDVFLYIRVNQNGKLDVRYTTTHTKVTGIGIKRGMFVMKYYLWI